MSFIQSAFPFVLAILVTVLPLGAAGLSGDESGPSGDESGGSEDENLLRIMSYNIRHGRGMDNEVNLERIAEVIRAQNPHLVALQEVDKGVRRTGERDLTAELAELTGMEGYFEMNIPYQGGEYGNAILSRLPILSRKNTHYRMIREGEQRGIIQVLVDFNGTELLFLNTHIDYRGDDTERMLNIGQFPEIVSAHPDAPAIIAGDFNDFPGSRVHSTMKEDYMDVWEEVGEGDGFTFRSDRPDRRIDYIWLARDRGLTPAKAWVVKTQASDHLPLMAEVEIEIHQPR